jgi:cold shock protein
MAHGTIIRIQQGRGFGFISPEDGTDDLFFHRSAVAGLVFDQLQERQRVEFDVGPDPRNPSRTRAENVRLIEP